MRNEWKMLIKKKAWLNKLLGVSICLLAVMGESSAQSNSIHAICSTDQGWCELAASEFQKSTGIKLHTSQKIYYLNP